MLGIHYFKAEPTEYAKVTVNGKTKKEGKGISCFYLANRPSFELIGTTTVDQGFSFKETTNDKQSLTIQGGFLYTVTNPQKTIEVYNFSIDPKTKIYITDDAIKLPEQIVHVIQSNARRIVQSKKLEDLLVMSEELATEVSEDLTKIKLSETWGVDVSTIYFNSIQPSPEISKALGAQYREDLLKKADTATYNRRASAVAQERAIEENQLSNQIELEQQRKELIDLQGQNEIDAATATAQAEKLAMSVFTDIDSEKIRAQALHYIGRGNSRVQTLMITPELFGGLQSK